MAWLLLCGTVEHVGWYWAQCSLPQCWKPLGVGCMSVLLDWAGLSVLLETGCMVGSALHLRMVCREEVRLSLPNSAPGEMHQWLCTISRHQTMDNFENVIRL
jgi:hypothetical protein